MKKYRMRVNTVKFEAIKGILVVYYLYLAFLTWFAAHGSDDIIFLGPYFIIIHF